MNERRPDTPQRIARFLLVGGASTIAYVIGVAVLVELLRMDPNLAAPLTYAALLPLNFLGQKFFTYNSRLPSRSEIIPFLAMHAITATISAIIMWAATEKLGMTHWAGSIIIAIVAPVVNFAMLEFWVFSDRQDKS